MKWSASIIATDDDMAGGGDGDGDGDDFGCEDGCDGGCDSGSGGTVGCMTRLAERILAELEDLVVFVVDDLR